MEKELNQLFEKESYDIKYISELREYWNVYSFALINEIYTGIAINLGLSEKEAYNLARNKPGDLQKAGFFKSIFEKFKNIFSHKVPPFRYKKKIYEKTGKPMTAKQWQDFSNAIDKYWSEKMNIVSEDITIKAHELGKQTANFRKKKKPYQKKSLYQINFDQYKGEMPKTFQEAYKKYDFKNAEKNALNKQLSSISMYVKQASNDIQEAIRQQVQQGLEDNKSPIEVASDLYWNVEKNEELNKYTAENLRRNWNRVANTEMASAYEAGILAEHEADAMESLKNPEKAQYFVFSGGTCPWCKAHQGIIVRLVPSEIVVDTGNDSLKSMGIDDPNVDIAVWVGKNNVGFKENKKVHERRVCTPAHPFNVATLKPINLKEEWYNPKTGEVEHRQEKQKYVPQQVDYTQKIKEEKDWRKPTFIENNLVRFNNNIYEAVSDFDYNRRLEEFRKNPQLPIPVNMKSPSYKRIFEEAEKNR